jgi:hypothetical protein
VTRRFADGSVELKRRGIYSCVACRLAKYGEPREELAAAKGAQP